MGGTDDNKKLLLGRYKLGRLLGQGNFAKVYQAKNVQTDEDVAIKMLDKKKIFEKGLAPQLKREIEVLRRVKHPYIVKLYEVMATKTRIYIVMEFVKGGELFTRVAKGRLQEDVARKYFQQLISAVAFCHSRGVFHRDIKPENLLVDENGDLKVSDFGLSAVAEQIRQDGLFHTLCGTPEYISPDVLARKGYDGAQADLWSCGVVLFVLMAGYPPFRDNQMINLVRKIYRAEFRCPTWFSPKLVRLVRAILEPNPKKRITIKEIMQNQWFKKDFKQISFYVEDNKFYSYDLVDEPESKSPQSELCSDNESPNNSPHASVPKMPLKRVKGGLSTSASSPSLMETCKNGVGIKRAPSLNAFDIISFSSGFNLSGLFDDQGEVTRLVSCAPVSQIIDKLEEIGNAVNFTVRVKDSRVILDATTGGGDKGPLRVSSEIFELTPKLVVIEVKKILGNADEYANFCTRELKPRLTDLLFNSTSRDYSESDTD